MPLDKSKINPKDSFKVFGCAFWSGTLMSGRESPDFLSNNSFYKLVKMLEITETRNLCAKHNI